MADFDEAKERLAFEAWYNQHGAFRPIQRQASGHYWPTHACEAWEAWQARALQPSAPAWVAVTKESWRIPNSHESVLLCIEGLILDGVWYVDHADDGIDRTWYWWRDRADAIPVKAEHKWMTLDSLRTLLPPTEQKS